MRAHIEVLRECAQAALGGESEGRMFGEDAAMQLHTDVALHVFRAVAEHLQTVEHSMLHSEQ